MFETNSFEYFSNLLEAGEVTLTPLGKVKQSKYPNKITKQPMWNVQVQVGDKQGYWCLDDHAAAKMLEVYAGNQITVQAERQGKTQSFKIISAPEGISPDSSGPPAKKARKTAKQGLYQILNALYSAKRAVNKLQEQALVDGIQSDTIADDVRTVMIYLDKHGLVDLFPDDHHIWSPASKSEAALEEEAKKIFKAKVVEPEQPEDSDPEQKDADGNFVF